MRAFERGGLLLGTFSLLAQRLIQQRILAGILLVLDLHALVFSFRFSAPVILDETSSETDI